MKKPFVTKEQLEDIVKQYPTPFHLYDEKGMRENARGPVRRGGTFAPYEHFTAGKTSAQGEFPSPEHIDQIG